MMPNCLLLMVVGITAAASTKIEEYASYSPSSSSSSTNFKNQPLSQGNLYYYYPVQKKAHHDNMYSGSSSTHAYATAPGTSHSYAIRPGSHYDVQTPSYSPHGTYGLSGLGGYGYGMPSYSSHPSYSYPPSVSYAPSGSSYFPQMASYPGYSPQQSSYGASNQNKRYGLSSLIMPMLALAGLGLLIPSVSGNLVSSGRKKRDATDPETEHGEKLEKYARLYQAALQNEECMNRVVCELGKTMKDLQGKTPMIGVMEKLVPSWMKPKMGIFKAAALSAETGKCEKYKC
ncbi:uncharacterized protein [Centruroides vittatus]|uniref:uncharacterized protein n=1 Tax=Centruroides vittatus TaxID=120091 RepID=UPI00350EF488